jgi:hypothetical protein
MRRKTTREGGGFQLLATFRPGVDPVPLRRTCIPEPLALESGTIAHPVTDEKCGYALPVVSGGSPVAPEARKVFRARDALLAHLDAIGERLRAAEPPKATRSECWCCGALIRNNALKLSGWTKRHHDNDGTDESYCPKCFDVWGWPDEWRDSEAAG